MKKFIIPILFALVISISGCNKNNPSPSEESIISESSEPRKEFSTPLEMLESSSRVRDINQRSGGASYLSVFTFNFVQYIDHNNHDAGTFLQKIEFGFNGFENPNVYVTCGYMADGTYSSYKYGENEIAFLLFGNYFYVEHRYFGTSLPVEINIEDNNCWRYLTTEQAAGDAHEIVTEFKTLLSGKWISTGMSKGGMTTHMFNYYYPGDVDLYVPYVAPFCNSITDNRMMKFIYEEVGNDRFGAAKAQKYRQEVLDYQVKMIEYRDILKDRFYQSGVAEGCQFTNYATPEILYEAAVLDYGIGFWQYDLSRTAIEKFLDMPEETNTQISKKQNEGYSILTNLCAAADYSLNSQYLPYYIQAYQELGNYSFDFSYLRNALPEGVTLAVQEEDDEMSFWRVILSEEMLNLPRKELMYSKINNMLQTTDSTFIIIYGATDPWYATRPNDVTDRENINIYVNPNHPHTSNINNFSSSIKNEIIKKIKDIVYN